MQNFSELNISGIFDLGITSPDEDSGSQRLKIDEQERVLDH